jgi:Family of unknown function (DUF6193)
LPAQRRLLSQAKRWNALLTADDSLYLAPELRELIPAAAQRPKLRQLFPVVSLGHWLGFSQTVAYPFKILAAVMPQKDENSVAFAADRNVLATGTISEVLDAVEKIIGPEVGPAIYGTADDLPD